MSKIAILVVSHILDIKQFSYIKKCLNSLLRQTYKSDILFSVSYSNKEIKDEFNEEIKIKYQSIFYYESDSKKSEFEHYYNLTNYIDKYDYITICDVDDFYENERIEVLLNSILEKNKKDNIDYIGVSERNYKQPKTKYFLVGAISYMLKPIVLSTFFNIIYEKNMSKYLKLYRCYTLYSSYLQIILWKTQKMYHLTVYDNLYRIEHFSKNNYIEKYIRDYEVNMSIKKNKIQDDLIACMFEQFNFKLDKIISHYKMKKNQIYKYISLQDYVQIKNLMTYFCFIKF